MSLVSDVRLLLNESSAAFWPDQQIYDSINQAQLSLYTSAQPLLTSATFATGTGQALVAIPSTIMIPKYLLYNNRKYFITSQVKLEQHSHKWLETGTGFPRHWVLLDAFYLRPYPRTDADYIFTMWGTPWPTEITASVLDITAPRNIKQAITHKAASLIFEHTRPDLADAMNRETEEFLMRYRTQQRNQHSHNISRIRPGNRLSTAQRGTVQIGQNYYA